MVISRKLSETEKAQGFKSIVFVRPADPGSGKGVVEQIDPTTGEATGRTFAPWERKQFAPGGRRGTGFLFVTVPPTPRVAAVIRRREEKQETRELAEQEATFEAKRIARGLPPVPLERKGAAKLLREKLKEVEPIKKKIEKKKAVKLAEVEKEIIKPKKAIELFSPLARERLGITETPEGLLEVRVGERKKVLQPRRVELRKTFEELVEEPFKKKEAIRKEVVAEIPVTAEFRTGFEKQLGTGKPSLIGIKTPSGVLSFKTIEEKIKPTTRRIFEPSIKFFKEEQLKLKRELRGRPKVGTTVKGKITLGDIRTIQLRTGQLVFGAETGIRKQLAEQPLETGAIIAAGALFGAVATAPTIAKAAAFRISSKVLGTAFVGATGVQAGFRIKKGDFPGAGEIIGERITEAGLFIGAGKLAAKGVEGVRKIRFERGVKEFERKIPKFTQKELRTRLETGGIETRQVKKFPKEIQTTFKFDVRVKTAEEALRTRIFAKAKTPLKRPIPPTRIAIIQTQVKDVTRIPPKILTLERVGKFDISAFGKVPKQFTRLRVRVGRLKDITIRDTGIQTLLVKPKVGKFRILPKPVKFKPPTIKPPKPFKGKIIKGVDRALLAAPDARLKLVAKVESLVGKPGRLTPEAFAQKRGFLFKAQQETPRIVLTQFGGVEIAPRGVLPLAPTIRPSTREVLLPISLGLFGTIKGLEVGIKESTDIVSGQKLRRRLVSEFKPRQDVVSDLERITGTKPKPAFDIASGLTSIQEVTQVQEQEQLLITVPTPRVPERGRPGFPPPVQPTKPPLIPAPPLIPFFIPRLFLGGPIKRKKRPLRPEFGFTPDFIASVLNQFGPAPKQRIFTGQERRFLIRGKPFLTPLRV